MSTATEFSAAPVAATLPTAVFPRVVSRLADYAELTKPRIALLVLLTVAAGYRLGSAGDWRLAPLVLASIGILLVAAGSSALNQYLERRTDARMTRTRNRPLPAGRLRPWEVLTFGLASAAVGCVWLWFLINPLTAILCGSTFVLYAFIYTPLKRLSSFCTAVGAIPGALPPVLGWTAAGGSLDLGALSLFGIMFLWQFPHFLAIAWLYREQYAAAGLRMLPNRMPAPRVTGLMATGYALALLPISLLPVHLGLAGTWYGVAALVLGLWYLAASLRFAWTEDRRSARRVLWVSLFYLPTVLGCLTIDHLRLLWS